MTSERTGQTRRPASVAVRYLEPIVSRFINRELSWLDFNERVLSLAISEDVPLLERFRFLAISASNLDEFYQVRVAALHDQIAAEVSETSPDGRSPVRQRDEISARVQLFTDVQEKLLAKQLFPALA
ncbi:MAG: RNA degradosome polyphosphate kinase, partial [Actinobacteria bacterium]|nr:RNA degradosome polyphosphate kinase [Actinomycetota bacterium]